jgi:hypothetical protein
MSVPLALQHLAHVKHRLVLAVILIILHELYTRQGLEHVKLAFWALFG